MLRALESIFFLEIVMFYKSKFNLLFESNADNKEKSNENYVRWDQVVQVSRYNQGAWNLFEYKDLFVHEIF